MPAPIIEATWALWPHAWAARVTGSAKGCSPTIRESSSPRTATVGPRERPRSRVFTPVSARPSRHSSPIRRNQPATNSAVRTSR